MSNSGKKNPSESAVDNKPSDRREHGSLCCVMDHADHSLAISTYSSKAVNAHRSICAGRAQAVERTYVSLPSWAATLRNSCENSPFGILIGDYYFRSRVFWMSHRCSTKQSLDGPSCSTVPLTIIRFRNVFLKPLDKFVQALR